MNNCPAELQLLSNFGSFQTPSTLAAAAIDDKGLGSITKLLFCIQILFRNVKYDRLVASSRFVFMSVFVCVCVCLLRCVADAAINHLFDSRLKDWCLHIRFSTAFVACVSKYFHYVIYDSNGYETHTNGKTHDVHSITHHTPCCRKSGTLIAVAAAAAASSSGDFRIRKCAFNTIQSHTSTTHHHICKCLLTNYARFAAHRGNRPANRTATSSAVYLSSSMSNTAVVFAMCCSLRCVAIISNVD